MKSEPWYTSPQTEYKDKRAIIIGGGLAGTSSAYSMAIRGWEVILIERSSKLANEASGNPIGILTPLITHNNDPIGEFYLRGFEHSLAHIKKIFPTPHSATLSKEGKRVYGVIELSKAKINKDITDSLIPDADIAKLSGEEVSELCGIRLKSNALYMEKSRLVNPADLCRNNILAGSSNITTIFSKSAISLVKNNDGWIAQDGNGNKIAQAPVVIIANAADAVDFKQTDWIPLQKVRGQLTYLPTNNLKLKKTLCYDGGYITPEIDGLHYVGATYSRDDMSVQPSLKDHLANIINLKKIIEIGEVNCESLQGRVSFRAAVIDRRPVIGAVPDIAAFEEDYGDLSHGRKYKNYPQGKYLDGLYISTGYGSRGLSACPIGGEFLAAMINNEQLPLGEQIVNALNPARFVIKKLKNKIT
jgi:tRNA 5-methylaminomethyl-2-thiouridine biosynthesis bifunctional protein